MVCADTPVRQTRHMWRLELFTIGLLICLPKYNLSMALGA